MRRLLFCLAAAAFLLSAAPAPDFSNPRQVEVRLANFSFDPPAFRLRANRPATLQLINASRGGHNFSAPEFFAASAIRVEDQGLVYKGAIELAAGQTKEITLVPKPGRYPLRCTHMMHATFGMRGYILVE